MATCKRGSLMSSRSPALASLRTSARTQGVVDGGAASSSAHTTRLPTPPVAPVTSTTPSRPRGSGCGISPASATQHR
eukprot:scaffold28_cov515-Prasinococcus_capsulatus_cf.AAC.8